MTSLFSAVLASPATKRGLNSLGLKAFSSNTLSFKLGSDCQISTQNKRSFFSKPTLERDIDPSTLDRDFLSVFPSLVKEVAEGDKDMAQDKLVSQIIPHFTRVLDYNVPFGKRTRGLATAWTYRYTAKQLTEEGVHHSYVLGWCVEMLQAYILLVDDIMDNSEMRRGRPSWWMVDGVGNLAMNDACYLYSSIFVLLKKYFENQPYYVNLVNEMHDVNHKTIIGQCLDSRTSLEKKLQTYSMELYETILKYKAGYYVTYLPMKLGMLQTGWQTDSQTDQLMRDISFKIGELYQLQNDFNDCFADASIMGKPGNDIENGKCSWNFIVARQKCNSEQEKVLLENYGIDDPYKAKIVKDLYYQLQIPKEYEIHAKDCCDRISALVQKLPKDFPKELFRDFFKAAQIQLN